MDTNPLIFISHATEDADLASKAKELLEQATNYSVRVFASSTPDAIASGVNWLDAIKLAMNDAQAFVLLLTKDSLVSHWIWFELGYYWHIMEQAPKERKIYPLYVSGLATIPNPISHLQAKWLHDHGQVTTFFRNVYYQFAEAVIKTGGGGMKTFAPTAPASELVAFVDALYGGDHQAE